MKRTKFNITVISITLILLLSVKLDSSGQEICITTGGGSDQITGTKDGYRYELWNQDAQGTACMTLGSGALFSGKWSGIKNYLARRGLGYNRTQEHQEIGRFFATYNCDYKPSSATGNSYLSIYGWTVEPLIEFYIIEDWRNWIPSMDNGAQKKGSITVNGVNYDIYQNTRVNQPSILGNATFEQYFSIRTTKRTSGTINISDHFDKWESLGMELGKLHEVSFVVEGYQSNGTFEFKALDVYVGEAPDEEEPEVPEEPEDPVTHVEETASKMHVSMYPNPSHGSVSIKLHGPVSNASVTIYDLSGKVMFSDDHIQNNVVEVSNLGSGIYFVDVNNNRLNYKSKLVVY